MSQTSRFERDREAEAKLAQKRVQNVEKHLGLICDVLGSITRKNARLRDKGDLLARHLVAYAESDELNPTSHQMLLQFAENYAAVQDYHHAKIQRMETKVLKPLTKYGEVCRYVKRNIKSEISVCGKEKKVIQKLEKLQEKTDDHAKIAQVELELDKVQGEEQLVGEAMEMEVDKFERDKIHDVKTILSEMVKIEMVYHAKALEYLSRCFESVEQINVDNDFDEFQTALTRVGSVRKGKGNVSARPKGNQSARTQTNAKKLGADASTLTSTGSTSRTSGSTTRSFDTRASGTFSSSGMSSTNRSRQSSLTRQPAPNQRQPQIQPSPRRRQSLQGRQSPQVRISNSMYGDVDDSDDDDWDD